jgi:hypothetical protein
VSCSSESRGNTAPGSASRRGKGQRLSDAAVEAIEARPRRYFGRTTTIVDEELAARRLPPRSTMTRHVRCEIVKHAAQAVGHWELTNVLWPMAKSMLKCERASDAPCSVRHVTESFPTLENVGCSSIR